MFWRMIKIAESPLFTDKTRNKKITDSGNAIRFLRHTFATTCVQYVRPDIVDTWMGDSSERLVGRVYTHFPDKFMTNQMDLVQFEF